MPEDFSTYIDPGIYIEELPSPVVSSIGIAPTVLGLVGDTQRYSKYAQHIELPAATPVELAFDGIDQDTVVVKDRYDGTVYEVGTDYTLSVADNRTSVESVGTGTIDDGAIITVSYEYTDADYFKVRSYRDYDEIRDRYGNPFNDTGEINSPITLAAYLAFVNGARNVIVAPLEPVGAEATSDEWSDGIAKLKEREDVNVVVPVSDDASVHGLVQSHVTIQSANGRYRRAFVGHNRNTPLDTIKQQARTFQDTRMTVVSPSRVEFYDGNNANKIISLDGQYIAVAVAGAHAGRAAQIPLTRKAVRGFYSIPDKLSDQELNAAQRDGVCVVWQRRNGSIAVRHGLTTDMSNIYTREISVQAAKDRLMTLLFDTLEAQGVIGSVITDETPEYVMGAVSGALETAMGSELINNYSGLKYRIPVSNPTMMEIRFQYKPSLPLNYVQIQFAIDTNTGMAEFVEA